TTQGQGRPGLGTSVGNYRAPANPGPVVAAKPPRQQMDVDDEEDKPKKKMAFKDADGADEDADESVAVNGSSPTIDTGRSYDSTLSAPIAAKGESSRRGRGCAGCATNDRGSTALLGLVLAALVLRRRRRR